ncbi:hypothetical protein FIBSPDRAFT_151440 [Athelia psychrophila]|uniref:Uncharacterized protein n=1 Tax=Athelia psychrophila TaxID=1759441 RepID=A0A166BNG4_9AGAM|nr:hypothetical protein FIBSPDRAFT_151440 [Fibularhizoctonia sp. CBS 109695]
MNSFFSLKRSVRSAKSPKKAPKPKPSSGRALAAIPEIEEEDFFCRSASSSTSSLVFPSTSAYSHLPHLAAPRPRERTSSNSSIVDVARERRGTARLSAYEFSIDDTLLLEPRPAPSPPRTPSPVKSARRNSISSKHSSGFRMVLGPGGLEFPRPPSTAAQHSCPSPTSTCTSSGTDDLPVSPTDDEFAFQLQAMPYTRPLHIRKRLARRRMSPVSTTPELSECESSPSESEEDTSEVGEWYTQQFSGVFAAPLPSPSPYACAQVPESPSPFTRETARPDSVISIFPAFAPAQKIQGRRPLPAIPATLMPSAQLDPSFPRRKRTICPPPAPVSASPVPVAKLVSSGLHLRRRRRPARGDGRRLLPARPRARAERLRQHHHEHQHHQHAAGVRPRARRDPRTVPRLRAVPVLARLRAVGRLPADADRGLRVADARHGPGRAAAPAAVAAEHADVPRARDARVRAAGGQARAEQRLRVLLPALAPARARRAPHRDSD